MTESQNISLNRPLNRNPLGSSPQHNIKQNATPEMAKEGDPIKQEVQSSLEIYGGGGKIRSEQPAARGSNIDITI